MGGTVPVKVDVRIIAATNRNLEDMVHQHLFREDLYYRLNVFPVLIDPLRKRQEDIIPLTNFFIQKYNQEFGLHKSISPAALNLLSVQPLQGNVRELQNIIQHRHDQHNLRRDQILRHPPHLHLRFAAHGRRAAYRRRTAAAPAPRLPETDA